MLASSPKTSDLTKNDFFLLNLAQNDEKVGLKSFSGDFNSFWVLSKTWFCCGWFLKIGSGPLSLAAKRKSCVHSLEKI